ncbi:MASE1 domain-containing protein [Chenggangzhangella methanolivorans]|uniref:MASE1 domain-containing protein n=1 Tax=Chenggangzhangella methanolivorans TaxID=1437009 RepID=A0A9E6RCG7_9HYPH|nr:MASE1 domain-containing protein [Chenggangzhangella methanolivorans]QZN98520.1 MASE1 domain-containing protein [Chenggangzhangella methanolivorans]
MVFATAYGGIEFTRGTARVAAIWPANAALLVIMLSLGAGRARMLGLAAAGYLGFAAANFAAGDGLAICLGLPVANLVEVMICRAALMRFGDHDLTRPRAFAMFCAVAAGPASLASSLTAVALFAVVAPSTALSSLFWDWYAADALGLVTFTPLFWSIATRSVEISRKRLPAAALTAAAFCALLAAIFVQSTYPVLFLVYPALIVVAFQFGFGGAAVALVVTATVAVVATSNGHGPLSLMRGTLREQIAILQIFVAVSAAMSLAVASVLAEREKLNRQLRAAKTAAEAAEDRLRESEARYRLLAENSSDVIALSGADGQVDYVAFGRRASRLSARDLRVARARGAPASPGAAGPA